MPSIPGTCGLRNKWGAQLFTPYVDSNSITKTNELSSKSICTGTPQKAPPHMINQTIGGLNYRSESLTMPFHHWKLAVVAAFTIGGMGTASAQNAIEQLQPLVETTAHRLTIGEQV